MTSAQVFETSVTNNNNCNYPHLDDHKDELVTIN